MMITVSSSSCDPAFAFASAAVLAQKNRTFVLWFIDYDIARVAALIAHRKFDFAETGHG